MEYDGATTITIIATFLIGAIFGAIIFSSNTEVPVQPSQQVCENLGFPSIEVEKIVEIPATCPEVISVSLQDKALATFLLAIENEEDEAGNEIDLLECDGNSYDYSDIAVSKVTDEWSVEYDDDKTIVNFTVRLKYHEQDRESCRESYSVTVTYETDEDTIVEYEVA